MLLSLHLPSKSEEVNLTFARIFRSKLVNTKSLNLYSKQMLLCRPYSMTTTVCSRFYIDARCLSATCMFSYRRSGSSVWVYIPSSDSMHPTKSLHQACAQIRTRKYIFLSFINLYTYLFKTYIVVSLVSIANEI